MRVAIISNITGQLGLQREYELLRAHLEEIGHEVHGLQYDEPLPQDFPACELCISLETVARHLLTVAPIHWIWINCEWFTQDLIPVLKRHFVKVFAKTLEAEKILEAIFPRMVYCTGFLSRDLYDPGIARERRFLHLGGNGALRNTTAVLDAWRWQQHGEGIGAELTIVSQKLKGVDLPAGVTVIERVSEEELRQLQNSHAFHLWPSGTEGFGQGLHESLSVNASILTVSAPPMSEVSSVAAWVPSTGKSFFGLATVHEVSALDIHVAAKKMLAEEYLPISWETPPRIEWMNDNELFKDILQSHLDGLVSKPMPKFENLGRREFPGQKRIAYLGNFGHSFCTESEFSWAAEHLGHEVIRVQEDKATLAELQGAVSDADCFWWTHTYGWGSIEKEDMIQFLQWLRGRKIPSCSIHLDKFWGIPEREKEIGYAPFWRTEYVFTADGGSQNEFASRGVNHFWMPPAVVDRGTAPGFPRGDLIVPVGFVGAVQGYHPEYPERAHLISFLEEVYGPRFRVFSGYREQVLNDLYASISVVVGDSCFANQGDGNNRYWSDRIPETMGRWGVLVHPKVRGLDYPGLTTYAPGNFLDLKEKIDFLLEHPSERRILRNAGAAFIRESHTYSRRVQEILDAVGLGDIKDGL